MTRKNLKNYPRDWTVVELKNLLERVRKPVDVIPDHEYQEIGIRSHGKGLFRKEPVKGRELGKKAVFWIEDGCLIINIIFAWEQAIGITTAREKGLIASHRFPMWRSKGSVDLQYLLNFFLTPLGKHLLELASPGGAGRNKTLGQDQFNKIRVCIPSKIKEQQRIVKIISTWDRAVQLEEQLIAAKKQQKKWLLQNLLTGKKRLPGFEGEWEVSKIGVYIKEVSRKNKYNPINHVVSVTKQKGIVDSLEYFNNHQVFSHNLADYKIIHKNEYAYSSIHLNEGSIGRMNHINEAVVSPMYTVFNLNENEYNSDYFLYTIKDQKYIKMYNTMVQGSINRRGSISIDDFSSIPIVKPPLPEQTAIASILSTTDREIELHEKQLEELKKQKKSLMQLLLTGIVRVSAQEVS